MDFFKKLNKKYLAVFLPLAVIGFFTGGVDRPLWWFATALGIAVIIRDLLKN